MLALEALAQRVDHQEAVQALIQKLSGIIVLVARKFANDRTADGLLEALYLTVGCISLEISQAAFRKETKPDCHSCCTTVPNMYSRWA